MRAVSPSFLFPLGASFRTVKKGLFTPLERGRFQAKMALLTLMPPPLHFRGFRV